VSRTRTLTNLIADCRRLAKMENSTFCSDADITELLNQEIAELYSRLVQAQGHVHYRSSEPYTVVSGTSTYALPATFWQVQSVEATINGLTGTLYPFMPTERARLSNHEAPTFRVFYRIQGSNIEFLPARENFTATLYYTPAAARLSVGSDTFDGFNGYEMAAIYGTVALMLAMEEADPSFWEMRKDKILARVDALAAFRDASNPERVQDVSDLDEWII
jgi:hypothetical protein